MKVIVIEIKPYQSKNTLMKLNRTYKTMPKKSDTWKIQLTTAINFLSSKDTDWECVMHLNSDSMKIMIYDKVDEFF